MCRKAKKIDGMFRWVWRTLPSNSSKVNKERPLSGQRAVDLKAAAID